MTTVEALVVAIVVLGIVAFVEAIVIAAFYRTRPVIERRSSNGKMDLSDIDVETTGIRQMRRAMKLVKPRRKAHGG